MIDLLLKLVAPVIKLVGKVRAPFSKKKVDGLDIDNAKHVLKPGYVILSTIRGELSNLINVGEFKHASMYVGGDKLKFIVESISPQVVETELVTFLMHKDRFVILRPKFASADGRRMMVYFIRLFIGDKYDYWFKMALFGPKYCSEVVYRAIKLAFPKLKLKHSKVLGRVVVRPDHFYQDRDNWEIVYDSNSR